MTSSHPGTKRRRFLTENTVPSMLTLSPEELASLEAVPESAASGDRYPAEHMSRVTSDSNADPTIGSSSETTRPRSSTITVSKPSVSRWW